MIRNKPMKTPFAVRCSSWVLFFNLCFAAGVFAQQLTVPDADTVGESLSVSGAVGQHRYAAVTGGVC